MGYRAGDCLTVLPYSVLADSAARVGLEVFGVISSFNLKRELALQSQHLLAWQEQGFSGEMQYMQRSPQLFAELDNFLPNVKSVVAFAVSYFSKLNSELPGSKVPPASPGYGRVARYAWGRDYHKVLRHRFSLLCEDLKSKGVSSISHREFSDAVPLLERAIASSVSLGLSERIAC